MTHALKFETKESRLRPMRCWTALIACVAVLTSSEVTGQAPFLDVSNAADIWTDHTGGYLGHGVSMADFNGDGLDDLSIAHHTGDLLFYVGDGEGFEPFLLNIPDYAHEAKCILWADIDNDGDQDLFITYRLAPNRLLINEGELVMTEVSSTCGIDQSNRRSYGACFGDYNNDGYLDLFVANYVSGQDPPFNELYKSNGDGTFTEVTFETPMGEPLQQNFQGQWVDFDEDGLLDLHLIRDRVCYENRYYRQMANGTFYNNAANMGLDFSINAMCTSTTDFDHDDDQDLYISAGMFEGNHFLVNDGTGMFNLHEPGDGDSVAVNLTSWAGTWFDADNDGWEDLHVCTGFSTYTVYPEVFSQYSYVPDNFYWNNEGEFSEDTTGFFDVAALSFSTATGDFNLDGSLDLINNLVGEYAQVLQGIPNTNRWLKVMLEGTVSNRDGIGGKIRVYADGLIGYHMTHCGENYLSQNSRWEHFGLGLTTTIDSITVHWPSGIVDHYYDVAPNQSLLLVEGETAPDPCDLEPCSGCTYPDACNFDDTANEEDGSCDFSCWLNETTCGPGTEWDIVLQLCVPAQNNCPTDLNGDEVTDVTDLLIFLAMFAIACP